MSESCSELIINAEDLARIRAQCQRREAELQATGVPQRSPSTPESLHKALPASSAVLPLANAQQEAERFAAAVDEMPAHVRAFFEREESPYIPPPRRESDQARLEREGRASFGGWCG